MLIGIKQIVLIRVLYNMCSEYLRDLVFERFASAEGAEGDEDDS